MKSVVLRTETGQRRRCSLSNRSPHFTYKTVMIRPIRFYPMIAFCALSITTMFSSLSVASDESPVISDLTEVDVFVSGKDGYDTYRIPSIIRAANGHLLAFCEGRKNGRSDTGNIDLVMKRSMDSGRTWSPQIIVWDDLDNTCGNPCPVLDTSTGNISLLLTWNSGKVHERDISTGFGDDSRRVFLCTSSDHGATWSDPRDITADTKREGWSWYATGPGAGIQIQHGPHAGRLVIPCDHKEPSGNGTLFYSHVIYSDDGGATWRLGGRSPEPNTNECEVVELTGGRLMLNMRNYRQGAKARQVCFSSDGGQSWRDQVRNETLIEPICQASIRRVSWRQSGGSDKGIILFSNPAHKTKRRQMTIRATTDDGNTWPHSMLIYQGDSAYSCLVSLPNQTVGCLYEKDGYKKITLALLPTSKVLQHKTAAGE